jgi:hypothetical protein
MMNDPADWPCYACGKKYDQHADAPHPSGAQPRMPCGGLKAHFLPRMRSAHRPPVAAPECAQCRQYRTALRAIVSGVRTGRVELPALADLAEVALLEPELAAERRGR